MAAVAIFSVVSPFSKKTEEVPLSEIVTMSQNREIDKIVVDGEQLNVTTTDGRERKAFKESNANIYDIKGLDLTGVEVDVEGSSGINWGGLFSTRMSASFTTSLKIFTPAFVFTFKVTPSLLVLR